MRHSGQSWDTLCSERSHRAEELLRWNGGNTHTVYSSMLSTYGGILQTLITITEQRREGKKSLNGLWDEYNEDMHKSCQFLSPFPQPSVFRWRCFCHMPGAGFPIGIWQWGRGEEAGVSTWRSAWRRKAPQFTITLTPILSDLWSRLPPNSRLLGSHHVQAALKHDRPGWTL